MINFDTERDDINCRGFTCESTNIRTTRYKTTATCEGTAFQFLLLSALDFSRSDEIQVLLGIYESWWTFVVI